MADQVQEIFLVDIATPLHIRPVDPAHAAKLAESIKARGLDTPVVVHERDDGYVLGYGRHRFEAFKLLGETRIPAFVKGPATDDELLAEQVAENLQRKDLTPLEEADLCAATLERTEGDEQRAAALMGRPLRWVQNRAALSRLHPTVREFIAAGQLPLGHAQLIARVASQTTQVEIARQVRAGRMRFGSVLEERPAPTKEVVLLVEAEGNTLHDVNWRLDVAFGTVQPKVTCDACPHNSANRGDLFAEGQEPKRPTCLLPKCHAERRDLSSRGARKAANYLSKEGLKLTPANIAAAITAREVPYVAPGAPRTYYQGPAPKKPAKGKKGEATKVAPFKPRELTAKEKLTNALGRYQNDLADRVEMATRGKPLVQAALALIDLAGIFPPSWSSRSKIDPKRAQAVRPLLTRLPHVTAADLLELAKLVDARDGLGHERLPEFPVDLLELVAKQLEVKAPPKPTLEAIQAEIDKTKAAEAKKAAAKKPAPKKKAA